MSVERPHEDRLATGGASTTEVLTRTGTGVADWKEPAFVNPMTTPADIIVATTAGAPARLAKGSDGQVLTVDPTTHLLVWATPGSGVTFATPAIALSTAAAAGAASTAIRSDSTIAAFDATVPVTQAFSDAAATGSAAFAARRDHKHGMPAGTSVAALDDLTDVTITTPTADQTLIYNGSAWVNSSAIWRPLMDSFGMVVVDVGTGEAIMALS